MLFDHGAVGEDFARRLLRAADLARFKADVDNACCTLTHGVLDHPKLRFASRGLKHALESLDFAAEDRSDGGGELAASTGSHDDATAHELPEIGRSCCRVAAEIGYVEVGNGGLASSEVLF